jgi:hypothetical protein
LICAPVLGNGTIDCRTVLPTIPEAFEAGQVVNQARIANPSLDILARAGDRDA